MLTMAAHAALAIMMVFTQCAAIWCGCGLAVVAVAESMLVLGVWRAWDDYDNMEASPNQGTYGLGHWESYMFDRAMTVVGHMCGQLIAFALGSALALQNLSCWCGRTIHIQCSDLRVPLGFIVYIVPQA